MTAEPAPPPQLELCFAPDDGGITRVSRRRVRYPYTFLKPFWFGDRPPGVATVMLQSASGGLFGGEDLAQVVTLAAGAAVHMTTLAATVVHAARMHPPTTQQVRVALGAHAYFEYLPEPLILFPGAHIAQRLAITLDASARCILGDGVVRHDPSPADLPFAAYRSDIEVADAAGRPLFADRAEVTGADFDHALATRGGRWRACGVFAIVAPAARAHHDSYTAAVDEALAPLLQAEDPAIYAGTAALPHDAGIVCRIAARDGAGLRTALDTCWRSARLALTGAPAPRRRK